MAVMFFIQKLRREFELALTMPISEAGCDEKRLLKNEPAIKTKQRLNNKCVNSNNEKEKYMFK